MVSVTGRIDEQVLNIQIGEILRELNLHWAKGGSGSIVVENTRMLSSSRQKKPDFVVFSQNRVPVLIESEYFPARTLLSRDVVSRVGEKLKDGEIVEQVIGLRIPRELGEVDQTELKEQVLNSVFEYCVVSKKNNSQSLSRWPDEGWIEGNVRDFAEFIEYASLAENLIEEGTDSLQLAVEQAATYIKRHCTELVQKRIAAKLLQENDKEGQTMKMAMAILVNALVFQLIILKTENIKNFSEMEAGLGSLRHQVLQEWKTISTDINYRPIFDLAYSVLDPIGDGEATQILKILMSVATKIATFSLTTQHDFGGQLFQKLINDRKILASFYTLPSSAAFLAELAVSRLKVDWSNKDAVTQCRLGDFACGTGALLRATYNAIRTRYRLSGKKDIEIHKDMMEKVFVGLDIMPAATHLTASILSSVHPTVIFDRVDLVTMPYGVLAIEEKGNNLETCIGSLDMIAAQDTLPLYATGHDHYSGKYGKVRVPLNAPHESFDLVIMNPPFTRGTSNEGAHKNTPNPAFAGFGTSQEEQEKMGARRAEIYEERNSKAVAGKWYREKSDRAGEGRAGLATWFVDLADVKVKTGGVIALILPATFSSGKFWEKTRILLQKRYQDILVVNIATSDTKGTAFSDDTGMAECIVVATRKSNSDKTDGKFIFASIDRRPSSVLEAVQFAKKIKIVSEQEFENRLAVGNHDFGRISRRSNGISVCDVAGIQDKAVEDSATSLRNGILFLPRYDKSIELPMMPLSEFGYRRKDSKYINGRFKDKSPWGPFDIKPLKNQVPEFPTLWRHSAKANIPGRESRLLVQPDSQAVPRLGMEKQANEYWKMYSTRLCFNQDFRLTSQRLAACVTTETVIGGRGWPAFICKDQRWNEPIVLWMNTTIGLISFWLKGTRQQSGRSCLAGRSLDELTIYNVKSLSDRQFAQARRIFNKFAKLDMLQANCAFRDPVRIDLDKAVLVDLLGLPVEIMESLELLRKKWCHEPSLHLSEKARTEQNLPML